MQFSVVYDSLLFAVYIECSFTAHWIERIGKANAPSHKPQLVGKEVKGPVAVCVQDVGYCAVKSLHFHSLPSFMEFRGNQRMLGKLEPNLWLSAVYWDQLRVHLTPRDSASQLVGDLLEEI